MDIAAHDSPVPASNAETDPKRRKVRKGTRSCWECKRRKIRCSFSTPSDPVCIGCRRRGVSCVSQDYPEERAKAASPGGRGRYMGDRIVRVEALIEQLVSQVGSGSVASSVPSRDHGVTPAPGPSHGTESPGFRSTLEGSRSDAAWIGESPLRHSSASSFDQAILAGAPAVGGTQLEQVSAILYAALPPPGDIQLMIKAGIDISFHTLITHPYSVLAQDPGCWKANLEETHNANTHPAILAKHLLVIATCLQFIHPELHAAEIECFSEPPHELMRRLAHTATSLVTNNDECLSSFEGLECVMLESIFEANCGNLRRAWFVCRRAMVVAQLLGIHRHSIQQPLKVIDPRKPIYPSYLWFRIVCTDRQLCLMLGLPQGSLDVEMGSPAALATDTPGGCFERKQSIIASRIIERNESPDPAILDDLVSLQELDAQLQSAANEMPQGWWLVPNLASVVHNPEKSFWETVRLMDQMLYFNLLNLLHLPYMLRSSTPDGSDSAASRNYEYSKLASVNASRELLTRFIMFRSFNRVAFCARSVDFFALIAAMTLVIAHLDGHRKQRQQQQRGTGLGAINVLAHHRNGDRAMMEKVVESMQGVARLSTDALSERSSNLQQSLMALEAEAAAEKLNSIDQASADARARTELAPDSAIDDGQYLRLGIPYFGTIKISREGEIRREQPNSLLSTSDAEGISTRNLTTHNFDTLIIPPMHSSFQENESPVIVPITVQLNQRTQTSPSLPQEPNLQEDQSRFPSAIADVLQEQYLYPGLTAGADDWAFQGVDMAFFNNITRGQEEG